MSFILLSAPLGLGGALLPGYDAFMSAAEHPRCDWPAWRPPLHLPLITAPPHPCAYLPGREATMRAFCADRLDPELYHELMNAGFRRSGCVLYQPICRGCRACLPVRVPVATFAPSRSQRRCRRRNADVHIDVAAPALTDEKHDLYRRYIRARHSAEDDIDRDALESFLYRSPVATVECTYRNPAGKLLAVGICDLCARSLSSVYFYFDPDEHRRALGTFGALSEIDLARDAGIGYYYLGYHVAGCRAMEYKATFRPCEILGTDGVWRMQNAE